ncbi:hypothetical protein [Mucilaginibacter lappiensis]|uniref:hypothetical protein n=1 Tax=Mucilaginibacter lappiensis TaxID=354630 RepID=UPI003D1E1BA5
MMDFKITFPAGYNETSEFDDNIDVNVIFKNGTVFVATLFTLVNIQKLMTKANSVSFWATDMVIVKNLNHKTIRAAIKEVIDDGYFESACTNIGRIEKQYPGMSFEQIPDMAEGYRLREKLD